MDPITIALLLGGTGLLALYYETLHSTSLVPASAAAQAIAAVAAAAPAAQAGNAVSTSAAARAALAVVQQTADQAGKLVPMPKGVVITMAPPSLDNGQNTGDN